MSTPVAVPITTVQPVFASVVSVAAPKQFSDAISPEMWGILAGMQSVTVRQHTKLLPKSCCACPPCAPQENTYSVYAGMTKDAEAEFLRFDEVSSDCNRCCCKPYHPLRLEGRQYVPVPGDGTSSDFGHLANDFRNDWQGLANGRAKMTALKDMYRHQPVVLSMVRNDGQRCCRFPCKWLSTFVCFGCCQDGMEVYAGPLQDEEGKDIGRPFNLDQSRLIGSATQPNYGGFVTPTLHLRGEGQKEDAEPFAKIEGPCCFGGWSEMCCNFQFFVSKFTSDKKSGDIAMIEKKKPASAAGALIELMSDADVYTIKFNESANLTPSQKVTILAGQLLADYMFFDGNTEKCSQDDNAVYCYCCYFSCIGAICPIYIAIPKNSGN
jgi:hypothetical protein